MKRWQNCELTWLSTLNKEFMQQHDRCWLLSNLAITKLPYWKFGGVQEFFYCGLHLQSSVATNPSVQHLYNKHLKNIYYWSLQQSYEVFYFIFTKMNSVTFCTKLDILPIVTASIHVFVCTGMYKLHCNVESLVCNTYNNIWDAWLIIYICLKLILYISTGTYTT